MARFDGSSKISDGNPGFVGDGYTNMGDRGSWIEWFNIPSTGGDCTFSFRYANGGTVERPCDITINGVSHGSLPFPPTLAWNDWQYDSIDATCIAGINSIKIKSTSSKGGANIDSMSLSEDPSRAPPTYPPVRSFGEHNSFQHSPWHCLTRCTYFPFCQDCGANSFAYQESNCQTSHESSNKRASSDSEANSNAYPTADCW